MTRSAQRWTSALSAQGVWASRGVIVLYRIYFDYHPLNLRLSYLAQYSLFEFSLANFRFDVSNLAASRRGAGNIDTKVPGALPKSGPVSILLEACSR